MNDYEELPLTEELDHDILMHRDSHFGGDFKVMLDYYMGEHVGIHPEFEIDRIEYLAQIEQETGDDLAPLLLSQSEAEQVARAQGIYRQLKALYQMGEEKTSIPRLIADLILTEDDEPEEEIAAIVAQGARIAPELIALIRSDDLYDPLFPGYGLAPGHAIDCLGRIGDPSAITPIFEVLGREFFFDEEIVLDALRSLGSRSKDFLLQVMKSRPITADNEHAAFALTAFVQDPTVAKASLEELQDPLVRAHGLLTTYHLCNCEGLQMAPDRATFAALGEDPSIDKHVREEIKQISGEWR